LVFLHGFVKYFFFIEREKRVKIVNEDKPVLQFQDSTDVFKPGCNGGRIHYTIFGIFQHAKRGINGEDDRPS
jgi:hypothetical protein